MVSIEHLRRVWHADRGRLLLRTPSPVPVGLAYALLVETNPFPKLSLFYRTILFEYPSVLSRFCFKLIEHLPMFYTEIFSSYNESKKNILIENLSMTNALLQPIWCNCLFKSKGKPLFLPNWIKSGSRYIRDLFKN